jgi:hypothetical protein
MDNIFTNKSSQMEKNKELQKAIHDALQLKPLLNAPETKSVSKVIKRLKKFIYFISLAGLGIIFNSCAAGYVASEPAYVEYDRPQRPSSAHIWINGDWGYNRQSRIYVQKTGYWQQPGRGRSYVSGHWQSTPRGSRWNKGYWQKEGHRK